MRHPAGLALAMLVLATSPRAEAATATAKSGSAWPDPSVTLGITAGVRGDPDEGGMSAALAALWPMASRLRFGVELSADDMGTAVVRLRDPNDGTDLGAGPGDHRLVLGAAWRLDVDLASRASRWMPYARGSWGYYRVRDDHLGNDGEATGAPGASLGAGVRRDLGGRLSLGGAVRVTRLFHDRVERFVAVGLEGSWR